MSQEASELRWVGDVAGVNSRNFRELNAATEPQGRVDAALCQLGALRTPVRWGVVALLVVVLVAVVLVTDRRADLGVYPADRMAKELVTLVFAAALLASVCMRPLYRPALGTTRRVAAAVVAVVAVVSLAASPIAHVDHQASLGAVGSDLLPRAFVCITVGSAFAGLAAVVLSALNRGGRSAWPGPFANILAATIGVIALHLRCPLTEPLHLWLGHVAVLVPFMCLAYLVRNRLEC